MQVTGVGPDPGCPPIQKEDTASYINLYKKPGWVQTRDVRAIEVDSQTHYIKHYVGEIRVDPDPGCPAIEKKILLHM